MSPRKSTRQPGPNPSQRYLCVHGHFYQPPRENPWLETVELQDSAAPFHDWNERITAECYAPNGASRITNAEAQIVRIVNNYARMSFNFGPTLLSWLEDFAPRTYRMIQDADQVSATRYSNHGSALAQVYNHIIMPLASERDARTQIRWGIADFEHRFGRKPRACGWPRPPSIARRSTCSPRSASSSRCWPRTRQPASASCSRTPHPINNQRLHLQLPISNLQLPGPRLQTLPSIPPSCSRPPKPNGPRLQTLPSIPPSPTWCGSMRAAPLPSSSTMGQCLAPLPLRSAQRWRDLRKTPAHRF